MDRRRVPNVNVYRYKFGAMCPVNGERIIYRLKIKAGTVIRAEDIRAAAPEFGLHESIADKLSSVLGGSQTLTATHGTVKITTRRPAP